MYLLTVYLALSNDLISKHVKKTFFLKHTHKHITTIKKLCAFLKCNRPTNLSIKNVNYRRWVIDVGPIPWSQYKIDKLANLQH